MSDATSPIVDAPFADGAAAPPPASVTRRRDETDSRVAEINSLLSALEEAAADSDLPPIPPSALPADDAPPTTFDSHENRLVQVRLGLASGLYMALRHKHPATASHSLRVALGCSTWALYKRLDDETRDAVEVAALLHDIGKIGVADNILNSSPHTRSLDDVALRSLRSHSEAGVSILACCSSSPRILDAVRHAGSRFDGVGAGSHAPVGDHLPLEARMIAIVDAFDMMTADPLASVTPSRDEALAKLQAAAGSLYDPILVTQFVELMSQQHDLLTQRVAVRWLNDLGKRQSELPWQTHEVVELPQPVAPEPTGPSLFEQQLIDSMHDGVIFVDVQSRIFLWSKGAERLTGVSASAAAGRQFLPGLLDMCNTAGRRLRDEACPVARALTARAQLRQRLEILGRQGEHVAIDLHAIPVIASDGEIKGATILLQDAQPEVSLEEKCEALHAEATKDPMTKVANRAEFDRMQALFIEAHQQARLPCSLIMTDIDHFKSINDTFGHQAGDEAIIMVANVLKQMCRAGDLVARYGGEEFAVLCADCTGEAAAARADQIRKKLSETPHPNLGNKRLTASFGVAQLQTGDSAETMLGRADRALLMAKEQGRNRVVQLGAAMDHEQPRPKRWWSFGSLRPQPLVQKTLTTAVPINIAIEKLRGFVSDQQARIISIRDNSVELEISSEKMGLHRRQNDRPAMFRIELAFSEQRSERTNSFGLAAGSYSETVAEVVVRPKRRRDRRTEDLTDRARLILQSLKAYLMAKEVEEEHQPSEEQLVDAK